ncbi:SDR family NAD(P)-dependent oxidoreductase [Flavobacterium sp.]|nr:SDR family NAD(P)-dependent oxidoreductase [Flavobacterium sp.]MCZ8229592.1 SDR family NAD(P)-dependent oxidoreductase [Flavobacterium sp.]
MNKQLIVITGASSGFGLEMAKEFSKSGYPLLLLAR